MSILWTGMDDAHKGSLVLVPGDTVTILKPRLTRAAFSTFSDGNFEEDSRLYAVVRGTSTRPWHAVIQAGPGGQT